MGILQRLFRRGGQGGSADATPGQNEQKPIGAYELFGPAPTPPPKAPEAERAWARLDTPVEPLVDMPLRLPDFHHGPEIEHEAIIEPAAAPVEEPITATEPMAPAASMPPSDTVAPPPEAAALEAAAEATEATPPDDIGSVLAEFETLGNNPEFGLLRLELGAGPDGLFGFSTMDPGTLITLLQSRLVGTGEVENLSPKTAWGSYYLSDPRYNFAWKSDIRADTMAAEAAVAQESARLSRLREALIVNLAENRRLFVYAGPATDNEIAAIRSAMRSFGENTLLHVIEAPAGHQPGQVVWQAKGLYRGYLSRFGARNGTWEIAVDEWVAVCQAAYALWKHAALNDGTHG